MKKYEAPVVEVIDFDKDYVLAAVTPRDSFAGGNEGWTEAHGGN